VNDQEPDACTVEPVRRPTPRASQSRTAIRPRRRRKRRDFRESSPLWTDVDAGTTPVPLNTTVTGCRCWSTVRGPFGSWSDWSSRNR